ncbi:septum formation protein [Antricoccus suffuscus]|uniref:Nucleoside triphosphate pyrophosphatase n=1 Tax=Antricoccus suffuscus TaxID=1629062 RepID=A0A2T0ZBZ2_9ACTN|nr:Maf family protein [Antricoccus suffuscus]PRZ33880.1 septum formation protein [Antricoccus suffuscus]
MSRTSAINVVLASRSPARRAILRAAGIDPEVVVSGVDEDAVLASMGAASPAQQVIGLATAKATAVASKLGPVDGPTVVIGCDSMFEMDGEVRGKPIDEDDAVRRLSAMRGNSGILHTGHYVVRLDEDRTAHGAASTVVHIGEMSDDEIAAYVDTGEPLQVAGAFTIDGIGGWFVDKIEGDHTNVVGLSLPLMRTLLGQVGIPATDLLHGNRRSTA